MGTSENPEKNTEEPLNEFTGFGISPGKAVGPVCLFNQGRHLNMPVYSLQKDADIEREFKRFEKTREEVISDLAELSKHVEQQVGRNEAAIFNAHSAILQDTEIEDRIRQCLEDSMQNVEPCVEKVFNKYEQIIGDMENSYLQERSTDIGELKRKLLNKLGSLNPGFECQGEPYCRSGMNRIIVAEELTPSLITEINTSDILGFVTQHGGLTSHAAILANSLGIPAVSGIHNIRDRITCGTRILIDGNIGKVWLDPTEEMIENITADKHPIPDQVKDDYPDIGIKLLANVNTPQTGVSSIRYTAEGAGLVRTEFFFMDSDSLPDEDKQFEFYSDIVESFEGKPVTFRLLDIGGDKPVSYIHMEHEENPYLGWRGTRLLLDRPDILNTQVRAIARAGELGEVEVMYPMIKDVEQLTQIKDGVRQAFDNGEWEQFGIKEGVMIEVPSVVFQLDEIVKMVDFLSLGTNDLIQYLFAVDRNNEHVVDSYDPSHPVLWDIVDRAVEAAQKGGIPVTVCGEMAGNPEYAKMFFDRGVTALSMSPRLIPVVREYLSSRL